MGRRIGFALTTNAGPLEGGPFEDKDMKQIIAKFIADEQGQDIIEYALLGSFVAFGAFTGAQYLGGKYTAWMTAIGDTVQDAADQTTLGAAPAAP
jgi:Flp pilus assembly pilin Flp